MLRIVAVTRMAPRTRICDRGGRNRTEGSDVQEGRAGSRGAKYARGVIGSESCQDLGPGSAIGVDGIEAGGRIRDRGAQDRGGHDLPQGCLESTGPRCAIGGAQNQGGQNQRQGCPKSATATICDRGGGGWPPAGPADGPAAFLTDAARTPLWRNQPALSFDITGNLISQSC